MAGVVAEKCEIRVFSNVQRTENIARAAARRGAVWCAPTTVDAARPPSPPRRQHLQRPRQARHPVEARRDGDVSRLVEIGRCAARNDLLVNDQAVESPRRPAGPTSCLEGAAPLDAVRRVEERRGARSG